MWIVESLIMIEYLDLNYLVQLCMLFVDFQVVLFIWLWDCFFDMNIQLVM